MCSSDLSAGNPVRQLRVAVLSQNSLACGNRATAGRLNFYLEADRHSATVLDVCDFDGSLKILSSEGLDAVFAVHALRSGALLRFVPRYSLNIVLILGGTDLQVDLWTDEELEVINMTVERAFVVVSFSREMFSRARRRWPKFRHKMMLIHASTDISEINPGVTISKYVSIRSDSSSSSSTHTSPETSVATVLLLGGIRPVKDILYVVNEFVTWRLKCLESHSLGEPQPPVLLIVGPEIDLTYSGLVKNYIAALPVGSGVSYHTGENGTGVLPCVARSLVQQATVVINTSKSEGLPTVILEAMFLGTPVIARSCPGNVGIVQHAETGLLFDSASDFIVQLEKLLGSPQLRASLVRKAQIYAGRYHSIEMERRAYQNLAQYLATPIHG